MKGLKFHFLAEKNNKQQLDKPKALWCCEACTGNAACGCPAHLFLLGKELQVCAAVESDR